MNTDALNMDFLRPLLPLPLWQKVIALVVIVIVVIAGYFFLGWQPLQQDIESQQAQVEQQRVILKKNQRLAKDLPRKRAEFAKLEKQLKVALNMLPKKSQIPDLLESVTWAGKDSGLEFSTFKPMGENPKQIYAEVPVDIIVKGTYRQLITFLKRVGEMPRIVAIKNLSITQGKAGGVLLVKGKAITYRFIEKATGTARKARKRR
ncbi:MAG: type 4a pilus biogenesis protein PilO [Mariprofundaceae bacterium]|nr:type 4a pilus biogenesis protein PilO [Mariprofundaceae bacterium]